MFKEIRNFFLPLSTIDNQQAVGKENYLAALVELSIAIYLGFSEEPGAPIIAGMLGTLAILKGADTWYARRRINSRTQRANASK